MSFDMGVADRPRDGQVDSASHSASLLTDWLEGHGMNPADIESLQREIQMDSPMLLDDLQDPRGPQPMSYCQGQTLLPGSMPSAPAVAARVGLFCRFISDPLCSLKQPPEPRLSCDRARTPSLPK